MNALFLRNKSYSKSSLVLSYDQLDVKPLKKKYLSAIIISVHLQSGSLKGILPVCKVAEEANRKAGTEKTKQKKLKINK